jgi:hypothetical protein
MRLIFSLVPWLSLMLDLLYVNNSITKYVNDTINCFVILFAPIPHLGLCQDTG